MTTYVNPSARSWTCEYSQDLALVQQFHRRLPGYEMTPLVSLPALARELGVRGVFVKDESSRIGLPAFKILGASWGTFRAVAAKCNLQLTATLDEVSFYARAAELSLLAATSGNHGRAIAYMAKKLGIPATIFLGNNPDKHVLKNISDEGAKVIVVDGDYDDAVLATTCLADLTPGSLHVQDYSCDGCEEIAEWVVDGYSTMMRELEQQLGDSDLRATHIVTPIGAGTLGLAVVAYAKSEDRGITVIMAEPEAAACLNHNLKQDRLQTIPTTETIMTGMICGNVNRASWPVLRNGVDVSVTITDRQCHEAICWLHENRVYAGPCGAGTLAGLRKAATRPSISRVAAGLDENSIVVLLSTEGKRFYKIPE